MKEISDLTLEAIEACQQSKELNEPPPLMAIPLLTSHHMDMLWIRMAEIYGHKWVSSYGDKPNHAWTAGLCDIPPSDIKYGIEAIIKSGESWPPSLPDFIEYCIGINDSDVIREIHKRYIDNLATYSDIAKIEKRYFKEVRKELIINDIHYTKLKYLDSLNADETKALQNQPS